MIDGFQTVLFAILQKIKENGEVLSLPGKNAREILGDGFSFCKNLISQLPNSSTETLSESINLMTAILIHLPGTP